MIKGLKVVMIVCGAIHILMGLAFIFVPEQLGTMMGYAKGPEYVLYFLAALGICLIAPGVFLIVTARDPMRHIKWVQFAITWAILAVIVGVYSVMRGFVTFNQAGMSVIIGAVFAVAFLALYPWRAARGGE